MKKIFLILVCIFGLSFNASAAVVKPGEKVHYKLVQLGFKVGEATLTFVGEQTYQNQKAILIIFDSQWFNSFDEERIYLDSNTYKPLAVQRDLNILGNKEKIQELYSGNQVKILKNAGDKQSEQTIDKAGGIDNIYAFIYRYRQSGEFKMNDRFEVHLPTKDITIKMVKRVALSAAGKKYNAFYMESDPAKYKLWFDSSEQKIPLRISGSVGVANTVMVMTKYEN